MICPRCGGSGRVPNDDPSGDPRIRIYCPVCWGSGQVKGAVMTREELRVAVVGRCDTFLAHPLWASAEQKATVAGLRKRVLEDDDFCDRWQASILPFLKEYTVAKSPTPKIDPKTITVPPWLLTLIQEAIAALPAMPVSAILQYLLILLAGGTPPQAHKLTCDPNCDMTEALQCALCCDLHAVAAVIRAQQCNCPDPAPTPPAPAA